jgi:hypothetical protein
MGAEKKFPGAVRKSTQSRNSRACFRVSRFTAAERSSGYEQQDGSSGHDGQSHFDCMSMSQLSNILVIKLTAPLRSNMLCQRDNLVF